MIKAKKGNQLIFGLSDQNIERLKNGEPIVFSLRELDAGDFDVMILHGKTEQDMYEMMKSQIHPYKTVIKNSRAKEN